MTERMIEVRGLGKLFTLHNRAACGCQCCTRSILTPRVAGAWCLPVPRAPAEHCCAASMATTATEGSIRLRDPAGAGEAWVELSSAPSSASCSCAAT